MITRKLFFIVLFVLPVVVFNGGCAESQPGEEVVVLEAEENQGEGDDSIYDDPSGTAATLPGVVEIETVGVFTFHPEEVQTVREDIFNEGYFSLFDVLIHLEQSGQIEMSYHFDQEMNTYVIDSLNNHGSWWYNAYYDGGWPERSVFRFDHYPYKDKMTLRIVQVADEHLESIFETYREEIIRLNANGGKIVVPEVIIEGKTETMVFENVAVTAHGLRNDIFKPGVVTALDTLLSLAEDGYISYDLHWYESLGTAGVVKSYWVNRINDDVSVGRCGFVYEAGNEDFYFFRGNHNHIPSDARVINSPQYVKYFWICI